MKSNKIGKMEDSDGEHLILFHLSLIFFLRVEIRFIFNDLIDRNVRRSGLFDGQSVVFGAGSLPLIAYYSGRMPSPFNICGFTI